MKYLKRYRLYLENEENEIDTEVNYEQELIGEYPNVRTLDNPVEEEQDIEE